MRCVCARKLLQDAIERLKELPESRQTIERLNLFPEMGHEGSDAGTYERGVSGTPYIVVFEVRKKPSALLVIAVMHGSRER